MSRSLKQHATNAISVPLSIGASLTLGLLSFGGIYAIYPSIVLGFSFLTLASLYEGQIIYKNIKDCLNKFLNANYYDDDLAHTLINSALEHDYKVLLDTKYSNIIELNFADILHGRRVQALSQQEFERFQQALDKKLSSKTDPSLGIPHISSYDSTTNKSLPAFFKDYQLTLRKITLLKGYQALTPAQTENLDKAQKDLSLMQRYFYKALTGTLNIDGAYANDLTNYVKNIENKDNKLSSAELKKKWIKGGFIASALSSSIFILGSVYLILEMAGTVAFLALPFPVTIILATICGLATAALSANSLSDMIWHNTFSEWLNDIRDAWNEPHSKNKAWLLTISSTVLIGLGAFLTVCTWGTWKTITREVKNIPDTLKKIPKFITGKVLPGINALSASIFTFENTKESLDQILNLFNKPSAGLKNYFKQKLDHTRRFFEILNDGSVPKYQLLNPFNFLIYVIETPLNTVCFLAHILSVSVTSSRIPHVPMWLTMACAFLSELLEDLHYFLFGDDNEEGSKCSHNHNNDIPSQFIHLMLSPLYFLSWAWHSKGKQWFSKPNDFYNFWNDSTENCEHNNPCNSTNCLDANCDLNLQAIPPVSTHWQQQKTLMQLKDKIASLSDRHDVISQEKIACFKAIEENVAKEIKVRSNVINGADEARKIRQSYLSSLQKADRAVLSKHRNFWFHVGKTDSEELIDAVCRHIDPLIETGETLMTSTFV